jgi:hypothetical protein
VLTGPEREVVKRLGDLWGDICDVVDDGPTRAADLNEAIAHIHALQHFVMSNAAARAHPDEFRLLGSTLPDRP